MKRHRKLLFWTVVDLLITATLIWGSVRVVKHDQRLAAQAQAAAVVPAPIPAPAPALTADPRFVAALDVARVFGRAQGCTDASPDLITAVANEAVEMKLDPRIFAATVAVESACNQYATSTKGAIGLTMVVPKVWKGTYDFERQYNLLNVHDNLRVGASIESAFIKQYGLVSGLRHYNGMGTASPDYDAAYTDKITALAGRK